MHEWTDAARQEMDGFVAGAADQAAATGADPAEVAEDLRRHVEQELAAGDEPLVTRESLRRILARIQDPSDGAGGTDAASRPARAALVRSQSEPPRGVTLLVLAGVVLPAFVLALELISGLCASLFFDPIPTVWHVALVALVPLANAWACAVVRRRRCDRITALGWSNGLAAGVALYYAIVFLPLSPFACIGVLYFGLGLVPLSPLIALFVTLRLRSRLKRTCRATGRTLAPRLWCGVLAVIGVLCVLEMPKACTLAGVRMATSEEASVRARGLRMLRRYGSRDVLLRAAYGVRKPVTDMISFVYDMITGPVPAADIQTVYYRVTGTPYNAVPPPDIRGLTRGRLINGDEFDFGQGGDEVAARVRGLSLRQSRMDAVVDADGCTAYTEWILVFRNLSAGQREARAQVVLPPGGVVSRLTLWIDGEEREAAFGGRRTVKEAYKKVVRRRRDPVLVTTSGPDQVLLQCFPVPPEGGEMKLRVGITAPLALRAPDSGWLRLPSFQEQNFGLDDELTHSVWIEADAPLTSLVPIDDLVTERVPGGYALRGTLTGDALERGYAVRVARPAGVPEAWSPDLRGEGEWMIRQSIVRQSRPAPGRVVVVIDGSRRMAPHVDLVAQALSRCPDGLELAVLLAADDVVELAPLGVSTAEGRSRAADRLRDVRFAGGCDNVPALLAAWDLAVACPDSAILWFHATQPVSMADSEQLLQRWQRRPGNPVLYDFQIGTGPNTVAATLKGLASVRRLPTFCDVGADMCRPFELWRGEADAFAYARRREPATEAGRVGVEATSHMARLWASDEVRALGGSPRPEDQDRAVDMACVYQLVTPVSGAVVLETAAQYEEAGLEPVGANTVPQVVPEPETWCLLLFGFILLTVFHGRVRHATSRSR